MRYATNREQSEKFIKLGLDIKTADFKIVRLTSGEEMTVPMSCILDCVDEDVDMVPAWSMSALMGILKSDHISVDSGGDIVLNWGSNIFDFCDDVYDNFYDLFVWYFDNANKEKLSYIRTETSEILIPYISRLKELASVSEENEFHITETVVQNCIKFLKMVPEKAFDYLTQSGIRPTFAETVEFCFYMQNGLVCIEVKEDSYVVFTDFVDDTQNIFTDDIPTDFEKLPFEVLKYLKID